MNRRDALKHTALAGGTALLSTSLLSLLQSCSEQSRLSWVPSFLSEEHALLVSSLVDAILPATDTPGGLDVKVDMFIDLVYAKMFPEEAREAVIEEMNAFNEKAKTTYGKAFADLGAEQQTAFLQEEEANSPKINGNVWGTTVGKTFQFRRNRSGIINEQGRSEVHGYLGLLYF